MDVVGIMLMWLVGIVFFPIIVYIVWKIYKYIRTLSITMQRGIAILTIITPLILYIGMTHITNKGYCIRDRKYFSEYSKEKMINDAIILLVNKNSDISLERYQKSQDFSKNPEVLILLISNHLMMIAVMYTQVILMMVVDRLSMSINLLGNFMDM